MKKMGSILVSLVVWLILLPVAEAAQNGLSEVTVEIIERPPTSIKDHLQQMITSFPKTGEKTNFAIAAVGLIFVGCVVIWGFQQHKQWKLGEGNEK